MSKSDIRLTIGEQALVEDLRKLAALHAASNLPPSDRALWNRLTALEEHVVVSSGLSALLQAFVEYRAAGRSGAPPSGNQCDGVAILLAKHQEELQSIYDALHDSAKLPLDYTRLAEQSGIYAAPADPDQSTQH